jgi:hypothetical protein
MIVAYTSTLALTPGAAALDADRNLNGHVGRPCQPRYGYRYPRAFPASYACRGYGSIDDRRYKAEWRVGAYGALSYGHSGCSCVGCLQRCSYSPQTFSVTTRYGRRTRPSYDPGLIVEVYEGGAPVNDAAREAIWGQLGRGHIAQAQASFGRWARTEPGNGEPHLGHALALALRQDHTAAMTAMRRVLKTDPEMLHRFQGNEALDALVRQLVDLYAHQATNHASSADPLLMTAALYYLLDDYDMANEAIAPVLRLDAGDAPSTALSQLIDSSLGAAEHESTPEAP